MRLLENFVPGWYWANSLPHFIGESGWSEQEHSTTYKMYVCGDIGYEKEFLGGLWEWLHHIIINISRNGADLDSRMI